MYRAGILKIDGTRDSENFPDKEKAEQWVLSKVEKGNVKRSIIVNKKNINERDTVNWEKE